MTNLIGKSLGRYHILEQLGEGGMAIVYKAYDTRLERDVAVKVIRTERLTLETMDRTLKRFEREAKSLAKLIHPNIVPITDYGDNDGKPYLVMPHLPGGTLKQRLGKPIFWEEAVRLLLPIARALAFAHQQGIIHRDVKPSNILITQSGEPMLTDFGIAKILEIEETADLTGTGMGIGTPEYMASEQWTGQTSPQSDQYAMGVVLYEMLTGRKPFIADTPAAILLKQATEPLPRPSIFARDLPEKVEKLLLKVLAKNPADRYASMGEFTSALESIISNSFFILEDRIEQHADRIKIVQVALPYYQKEDTMIASVRETTIIKETTFPDLPHSKDGLINDLNQQKKINGGRHVFWIRLMGGLIFTGLIVFLIIVFSKSQANLSSNPPSNITENSIPTKRLTIDKTSSTADSTVVDEVFDSKGIPMMFVPAGVFTMGSEAYDDAQPIHQVYLDAYYMDKYEVTNAFYNACANAGICDAITDKSSRTRQNYYRNPQFDDYPVINVSWFMAKAYCEWRGARLPTEAEWEKAARGTDSRTYPYGESTSCNQANYCEKDTTKVGSYPSDVSPYGLYDMGGNIAEWIADWYSPSYYKDSPFENPLGPNTGYFNYRVYRGALLWDGYNETVSVSSRLMTDPLYRGGIGFRCVTPP